MISSEVERTLVKSPPELWAEISDPAALARHLGALGQIEIVRTEPEKLVEWEAEGATGTVRIKPSGWGTKVTLTVCKELPAPADVENEVPAAAEDEATEAAQSVEAVDEPEVVGEQADATPEADMSAAGETEDAAAEQPRASTDAEEAQVTGQLAESADTEEMQVSGEPDAGADAEAAPPEPEPRHGFFARLFGFGRRRTGAPATTPAISHQLPADDESQPQVTAEPREPAIEATAEPSGQVSGEPSTQAAEPAAEVTAASEKQPEETVAESVEPTEECRSPEDEPMAGADPGEPAASLAAELRAAEEVAAEEVEAVLTAVLDRLGAAHHRPFSRA